MQLLCKEKLAEIRNNPIYSVYNQKIISSADEVLYAPIEVISYQEHMFFYREHFRNDKKKLERIRNLSILAAAYLLTEKEEYLFRAEDYIWAICDEFSWALPAHLKEEGMRFVYDFVMCSGSLKALAQKMDLSYPSVRNRLDDILAKMESMTNDSDK